MSQVIIVPHDYGCPTTQMRQYRAEFEQYVVATGLELDLHMKRDSPHYSSGATRKAYSAFVSNM